jgi:hypothetical protein
MTREHAKKMLPIITAFAEGENVETINWKGEWIVATDLTFECEIDKYRIADLHSNDGRIDCHCIELPPIP